MSPHDALRDREAKACTAAIGALALPEAVEHERQVFRCDAHTGVLHDDQNPAGAAQRAHAYMPSLGRELDRIAHQVREYLRNAVRIDGHDRQPRLEFSLQRHAARRGQRRKQVRRGGHQRPNGFRFPRNAQLASLEACHVEQILNERVHLRRGLQDHARMLGGGRWQACRAGVARNVQQRRGEHLHRVHGVAQVMRHESHQVVAVTHGIFRVRERALHQRLTLPLLRDVAHHDGKNHPLVGGHAGDRCLGGKLIAVFSQPEDQ